MMTRTYKYEGEKIVKVTPKDYIVYNEDGTWKVHTKTLREAKGELDFLRLEKLQKEYNILKDRMGYITRPYKIKIINDQLDKIDTEMREIMNRKNYRPFNC